MSYPDWGFSTGPVSCRGCKELIVPGDRIWIKAKGVYYCNSCGLIAEQNLGEVVSGGIEEGLIKDLDQFPDEAADTVLAKMALSMARQLDQHDVAPREVTQYTKEIRLNFLQLRDLYPPEGEEDDTDNRREKLAERRRREQGGI